MHAFGQEQALDRAGSLRRGLHRASLLTGMLDSSRSSRAEAMVGRGRTGDLYAAHYRAGPRPARSTVLENAA
jgi:hypothetical protein